MHIEENAQAPQQRASPRCAKSKAGSRAGVIDLDQTAPLTFFEPASSIAPQNDVLHHRTDPAGPPNRSVLTPIPAIWAMSIQPFWPAPLPRHADRFRRLQSFITHHNQHRPLTQRALNHVDQDRIRRGGAATHGSYWQQHGYHPNRFDHTKCYWLPTVSNGSVSGLEQKCIWAKS